MFNKSDSEKPDSLLRNKEWELIFDAVPDCIALIDDDFHIKKANKAMIDFLGSYSEDIIDSKCYKLVHSKEEPIPGCPQMEMLRDKQPHTIHLHEETSNKDLIVFVRPISDDGKLLGSVHIIHDDTERRKLEASNEKLAAIVKHSNDAIIGKDLNGIVKSWNTGAEKIYGYSAHEIKGKNISILIPPDHKDDLPHIIEKIRNNEEIKNYDTERVTKEGERIQVSLTISPINDSEGHIIGASTIARDITEIYKAKKALEESENKYRKIFENVQDVFYQTDKEGIIVEISPSIQRYSGYTKEELIGKPVEMVYLDPENRVRLLETIEEKGEIADYEVKLKTKDNKLVYASVNAHPLLDVDNNPIGIEGSLRDITERRKMEDELRNLLDEKEMLLKEIHHRVKNNLMIISSLLDLQSQDIRDADDLRIFQESQARADSMALIHERLYQSTDLKHINFGEYIQSLANALFNTYVTDPNRIKLNFEVEDIEVDINTAIPLGLIVNELITNSMKHGFPDDKRGKIDIKFSEIDDNLCLEVYDDGVGLPENLDIQNTSTLGLQLVNSLTSQIDGELDLKRDNGTEFKIIFKEEEF